MSGERGQFGSQGEHRPSLLDDDPRERVLLRRRPDLDIRRQGRPRARASKRPSRRRGRARGARDPARASAPAPTTARVRSSRTARGPGPRARRGPTTDGRWHAPVRSLERMRALSSFPSARPLPGAQPQHGQRGDEPQHGATVHACIRHDQGLRAIETPNGTGGFSLGPESWSFPARPWPWYPPTQGQERRPRHPGASRPTGAEGSRAENRNLHNLLILKALC